MFERSLVASQVQHASVEQRWTAAGFDYIAGCGGGAGDCVCRCCTGVAGVEEDPPKAFVASEAAGGQAGAGCSAAASVAPASLSMLRPSARFVAPMSVPPIITDGP